MNFYFKKSWASKLLLAITTAIVLVFMMSQAFTQTNEIIIKKGESFPLINNSCSLTVEGVYSSFVEGYLNGEKVNFRIGKEISFLCLGYEGKVVLTRIESQSDTATFKLSYMKNNS